MSLKQGMFHKIWMKILFVARDNGFWLYTLFAIVVKSLLFVRFIVGISEALNKTYQKIWLFVPTYVYFAVVLLCFAFLMKGKLRTIYIFFCNILISILLLLDLLYYRSNGAMTSVQLLSQVSVLSNLWDCVLSMYKLENVLIIMDVPIILVYIIAAWRKPRADRRNIYFTIIVLAASMLGAVLYAWLWPAAMNMYDSGLTTIKISPIGYHILDLAHSLRYGGKMNIAEEDAAEICGWLKQNERYNRTYVSNIEPYKGIFAGKNLLIIQIESLENFVIENKVNGKKITPNLDKMLKHSLYFINYHEQINQGTTSDAELMTNTSTYPISQGSTFFMYPTTTYNSLPKIFERNNYRTIAFHSDAGSYWNWKEALTNIGFEECVDRSQFKIDEEIGLGLSDSSYFRQLVPKIVEQKQPFYAFMTTLSSHAPFNLPAKYRELGLDKELNKSFLGGYLESIHYTDKHLGNFLNSLDEKGILEDTVVVIYGDHEGPSQYYAETIEKFSDRLPWILNNKKKVPFIIYSKDINGVKISTIGGQIDALPTICYLLGISQSEYIGTAMGRNLLNTTRNFVVLRAGYYIGDDDQIRREHAIKGQLIADKIIRSNYYKICEEMPQ